MKRFKSKKILILSSLVLIILAGGLILNYLSSPSAYPVFAPIEEMVSLTKEEYLEDFDFAYDILKSYYPYIEVNERVHGVNWLENRDIYRDKISQCKNDDEFYENMI